MQGLGQPVQHVLAAIANMHIGRQCDARQHPGGDHKISIDGLGELLEAGCDIQGRRRDT